MFLPPPPPSNPPPSNPLPSNPPPGQPAPQASDADLQELADYVIDCLNHGSAPEDIQKTLIAKGLSEADAQAVVDQVLYHQTDGAAGHDYRDVDAVRALGRRNMLIGGTVGILGLFVTCGTMVAAGDGGGRVVVAWGAIVWGLFQFLRGVAQSRE